MSDSIKKILYIGEPDDYVNGLQEEIKLYLKGCNIVCQTNVSFHDGYDSIEKHSPLIVLLSYAAQDLLTRKFLIMIRKVFGNITFAVLADNKKAVTKVEGTSSLGDYLYWIKKPDHEEIIEYLSKKLTLPSNKPINSQTAYYTDQFDLYQCMHVSCMNRTHAQIETNYYFENDTVIPIKFPYHEMLFYSDRHKISKRSTSSIGSHFKYSYSLEYILHTKKMNSSERIKLIKDYRYEIGTKKVNENVYLAVIEATKEKKFSVLPEKKTGGPVVMSDELKSIAEIEILSRALYFNWLLEQNQDGLIQKDTITVYDRQKHLLKEGIKKIENESTTVIHRKEIVDHEKNMQSDMPSIIVVYEDEFNTLERVKKMISAVTLLKDHFPFIVLFNYTGKLSPDDLRHKLEYHFVLSTPSKPDPNLIIKMLQFHRNKLRDKEFKKGQKRMEALRTADPSFHRFEDNLLFDYKVFKNIDDPSSWIIHSSSAEVIWISETEIMFRTNSVLEVGDIFRITKPFDLQIEVLKKESDDKEFSTGKYTAYMHFVYETDRIAIKGFVKELSTLNDQNVYMDGESTQKLKDKYFPFNEVYNL